MSELVSYMIFVLSVIGCLGQHTYNGNYICDSEGKSRYVGEVKKAEVAEHCSKHHTKRLELFEVDCCISEVTQNMDAFQKTFQSVVIKANEVRLTII